LDASPGFTGRLDLPFLLIPAPKMCCDLSNWARPLSLQRTMKKGKAMLLFNDVARKKPDGTLKG
jgi:hypothetical protein